MKTETIDYNAIIRWHKYFKNHTVKPVNAWVRAMYLGLYETQEIRAVGFENAEVARRMVIEKSKMAKEQVAV